MIKQLYVRAPYDRFLNVFFFCFIQAFKHSREKRNKYKKWINFCDVKVNAIQIKVKSFGCVIQLKRISRIKTEQKKTSPFSLFTFQFKHLSERI